VGLPVEPEPDNAGGGMKANGKVILQTGMAFFFSGRGESYEKNRSVPYHPFPITYCAVRMQQGMQE